MPGLPMSPVSDGFAVRVANNLQKSVKFYENMEASMENCSG